MSTLRRATRVVVATLLAVMSLMVWSMLRAGSPDAAAQRWAASGRLSPTTIEHFRPYPDHYRVAMYRAQAPAAKAELWQQHLTIVADTEPGLSPAQRQSLRDLRGMITVADFQGTDLRAAVLEQAELTRRMLEGTLAAQLINDWQYSIGRTRLVRAGPRHLAVGLMIALDERIIGWATASAQTPKPDCKCYVPQNGEYDCPAQGNLIKGCAVPPPNPGCQVIIPGGSLATIP